jgi:hypothetical protein
MSRIERRGKMKAYEYYAEVLPDGHLSLPEGLREKIKGDAKVRVMVLLEDDDAAWNNLTMTQFLKGYSEKDALYDNL